jgi:hypothetical protein
MLTSSVSSDPHGPSGRRVMIWSLIVTIVGVVIAGVGVAVAHRDASHDRQGTGAPVSSYGRGTSTSTTSPRNDGPKVWVRRVAAACTAMRPRFAATSKASNNLLQQVQQRGDFTPHQAQQFAMLMDQFASNVGDLSGSVSRHPPPAAILDRVTDVAAKLDGAQANFSEMAAKIRLGAFNEETQAFLRSTFSDVANALRTLGFLGATSCSELFQI